MSSRPPGALERGGGELERTGVIGTILWLSWKLLRAFGSRTSCGSRELAITSAAAATSLCGPQFGEHSLLAQTA